MMDKSKIVKKTENCAAGRVPVALVRPEDWDGEFPAYFTVSASGVLTLGQMPDVFDSIAWKENEENNADYLEHHRTSCFGDDWGVVVPIEGRFYDGYETQSVDSILYGESVLTPEAVKDTSEQQAAGHRGEKRRREERASWPAVIYFKRGAINMRLVLKSQDEEDGDSNFSYYVEREQKDALGDKIWIERASASDNQKIVIEVLQRFVQRICLASRYGRVETFQYESIDEDAKRFVMDIDSKVVH